jgi:hypothetical protein
VKGFILEWPVDRAVYCSDWKFENWLEYFQFPLSNEDSIAQVSQGTGVAMT